MSANRTEDLVRRLKLDLICRKLDLAPGMMLKKPPAGADQNKETSPDEQYSAV